MDSPPALKIAKSGLDDVKDLLSDYPQFSNLRTTGKNECELEPRGALGQSWVRPRMLMEAPPEKSEWPICWISIFHPAEPLLVTPAKRTRP